MAGSDKRRVVVTGIGAISPLGNSINETWSKIVAGKSGIGRIESFDVSICPVKIAGEVHNFEPTRAIAPLYPRAKGSEVGPPLTQVIHPKTVKKIGKFIQYAMSAGIDAYIDSKIDPVRRELPAERMGINIGVGMGGLPEIEAVHDTYLAKGYGRITPFFIPQVIPNLAAGNLGIELNLKGPNMCNVTACTSSAHAIGESYRMIQNGIADVMLAGGAESTVCALGIGGFNAMKALSTRNETPEKASRPFDQGRDGFVMGEGAAVLVLEEYELAKSRGAKIYGEVIGYGLSGDAYHVTSPAPEGEGGYRAMIQAFEDAGISPQEIEYINAHGTSTPTGDTEEAGAVRRLYQTTPKNLHISSTKSMTGHLLGAAGALEAIFCILAIRDSVVPPTINLENLDPKCAETGLDFTANQPVRKTIDTVLTNSFGFGGTNGSLILRKV